MFDEIKLSDLLYLRHFVFAGDVFAIPTHDSAH